MINQWKFSLTEADETSPVVKNFPDLLDLDDPVV